MSVIYYESTILYSSKDLYRLLNHVGVGPDFRSHGHVNIFVPNIYQHTTNDTWIDL